MCLPVAVVEIGVLDGIAAVYHLAAADIDTNMCHRIAGVICPRKEDQIPDHKDGVLFGRLDGTINKYWILL